MAAKRHLNISNHAKLSFPTNMLLLKRYDTLCDQSKGGYSGMEACPAHKAHICLVDLIFSQSQVGDKMRPIMANSKLLESYFTDLTNLHLIILSETC